MYKPQLKGTEKQIAWANDIREKQIADLKAKCPDGNFEMSVEELDSISIKILEKTLWNTSAAWWIENRRESL